MLLAMSADHYFHKRRFLFTCLTILDSFLLINVFLISLFTMRMKITLHAIIVYYNNDNKNKQLHKNKTKISINLQFGFGEPGVFLQKKNMSIKL